MRQIEPTIKVLPINNASILGFNARCKVSLDVFSLEPSELKTQINELLGAIIIEQVQPLSRLKKLFIVKNSINEVFQLNQPVDLVSYCFEMAQSRKESTSRFIKSLLNNDIDELRDIFTSEESCLSYINGFKKLEEILDNEGIFSKFICAFDFLMSLCAYPCLYAILNLIVLPHKNDEHALFITIPPLHIAPFNIVMSLNFILFFNPQKNRWNIGWLSDDISAGPNNSHRIRLKSNLGHNYMNLVEKITGKQYKTIFPINTCSDIELADDPPLKKDDECEIFLNHVFGINVAEELKEKELRERRENKEKRENERALEYKIIKEEYVAKVSMSYKTYTK